MGRGRFAVRSRQFRAPSLLLLLLVAALLVGGVPGSQAGVLGPARGISPMSASSGTGAEALSQGGSEVPSGPAASAAPGAVAIVPQSGAVAPLLPTGPGWLGTPAHDPTLGRMAPSPAGTVVESYRGAAKAVSSATSTFDGGGWAMWTAFGVVDRTTEVVSFNTSSAGCSATWVTTPSGSLSIPATPLGSAAGTSAVWGFELYKGSSESTATLLYATVLSGAVTLWYTGPLATCHTLENRVPGNAPVPSGTIDSSAAVNSTNAIGGTAFLSQYPNPDELLDVETSIGSELPTTIWGVAYTSTVCIAGRTGTFGATVDGLTGDVLELENYSTPCAPATYSLKFTETGLPAGNGWWVTVHGTSLSTTYESASSAIVASLPNGSYGYQISTLAAVTASPATGAVTINGANESEPITFTPTILGGSATFTESGLPAGTGWFVVISGDNLTENLSATTPTTSIMASFAGGEYDYRINATVGGYQATPGAGNFLIADDTYSDSIFFTLIPTYNLTFDESGLPSGTWWGVAPTLDRVYTTASSSSFTISIFNGFYNYSAGVIAGYSATPMVGNYTVFDQNVTLTFVFAATPEYPVTLTETGLTKGGAWTIALVTSSNSYEYRTARAPSIVVDEPDGTYTFFVFSLVPDLRPSPLAGSVTVSGGPASQAIVFESEFWLTFVESGLPTGSAWSIALTSPVEQFNSSFGPTTAFLVTNGTVGYNVTSFPVGYNATIPTGTVSVAGTTVYTIDFTPPPGLYVVTFRETGLPAGKSWSVTYDFTTYDSTYSSIVFGTPNGSYSYSIGAPASYRAHPATGTLAVSAGPAAQSIAFTLAGGRYVLTFVESGLPLRTNWSVTLGTGSVGTTNTSFGVIKTNGSYAFSVGLIGGYAANPESGMVKVNGANSTESITFSRTGVAPPARSPGFLGLSGNDGYYLLGGVAAAIVAVGAVTVLLRKPRSPPPQPPEPPAAPPTEGSS